MAKIDSQPNRATAYVDDEPMEQFYRPTAASTARARTKQELASERRPVRRVAANPLDDDSPLDNDDAFLRARRRVPVRRGLIPISRWGRIAAGSAVALALALVVLLGIGVRNFFRDDPRFRIASSSSIQVMGLGQVTRPELLSVFGSDLGRNIFFVPLEQRRLALQQLPWVEHATLMRLLPDQLRISIVERTPVAFVRQGNSVGLVDAHGVLLPMGSAAMAARHYGFPVVSGITAKDPLSLRAARMHLYQQFVSDLDSGGSKISNQLSEVDLSDPEDISALLPAQGSDILVHFGDTDFLARYRSYQQHLPEWRQQYPHLASVDMRYENQVVLDMAQQSPSPTKPAAAAPVKTAVVKHPGHTAPKYIAHAGRASKAKTR